MMKKKVPKPAPFATDDLIPIVWLIGRSATIKHHYGQRELT